MIAGQLTSRTQDTEITRYGSIEKSELGQRHCNFPKVHLTWNKEMQLIKLLLWTRKARRSNFLNAIRLKTLGETCQRRFKIII